MMFFILFDTYSKWVEVYYMKRTDSVSVSKVLRRIFSIFGLPKQLVADNGPPFSSKYFKTFCKNNNIIYTNSPEYNPQSNGSAERAVGNVKSTLKKFLLDKRNQGLKIEDLILNFLFNYRNMPSTVTNKSPNEMIFNFLPRKKVQFLKPEVKNKNIILKREEKRSSESINCKREIKHPQVDQSYIKGEHVWYKTNNPHLAKWIPAKIINKLSPLVYNIQLNGGNIRKAHLCQLKDKIERQYPKYYVDPSNQNIGPRSESYSPIASRTRAKLKLM